MTKTLTIKLNDAEVLTLGVETSDSKSTLSVPPGTKVSGEVSMILEKLGEAIKNRTVEVELPNYPKWQGNLTA